jgi:hypothetical protein
MRTSSIEILFVGRAQTSIMVATPHEKPNEDDHQYVDPTHPTGGVGEDGGQNIQE